MATLLAHIAVQPGHEARFEAAARRLHAATHTSETAVRRYEYWRAQEPGRYYALLAFDDYRGFLAHQSSPHHEAELAELGAVIADIRLEWLDPVSGASPLPATLHQSPAADAGEVARRYAETMPAVIAGWWAALRQPRA